MAERFGVEGRGAFYDQTGAVRDVIQNHLFQVVANLAMEPPARIDRAACLICLPSGKRSIRVDACVFLR